MFDSARTIYERHGNQRGVFSSTVHACGSLVVLDEYSDVVLRCDHSAVDSMAASAESYVDILHIALANMYRGEKCVRRHTYIHTYIHAYVHTYNVNTCIHTNHADLLCAQGLLR